MKLSKIYSGGDTPEPPQKTVFQPVERRLAPVLLRHSNISLTKL